MKSTVLVIFSPSRYLEACLDRESIRPQDVRTVFAVVAANPAGRLLAWRHLRAHWDHLQDMFGEGSFTMGSLITAVVTHFSSEFDYNEVSYRHLPLRPTIFKIKIGFPFPVGGKFLFGPRCGLRTESSESKSRNDSTQHPLVGEQREADRRVAPTTLK